MGCDRWDRVFGIRIDRRVRGCGGDWCAAVREVQEVRFVFWGGERGQQHPPTLIHPWRAPASGMPVPVACSWAP